MSFGREKRLLLGMLALLAPLPLPFNQAIQWWLFIVYALLVACFIQRADRDPPGWLPNWALNVLALIYMPVLALDLQRGVRRSSFLEPLLHLLLFLVVVKLCSLRREQDKWHALVAVFFLFTGAMATSSHLTITFYLLVFFGLAMVVLARFAHLYVLGGLALARDAPASVVPVRGPVAAAVILGLVLAVPLFTAMPRVTDPFIFGPGAGMGMRSAGMGDSVDLNATSAIRGNRTVALRLRMEEGLPPAEWRFKAATYDRYENGRWARQRLQTGMRPLSGPDRFNVAAAMPAEEVPIAAIASIYLAPLRNNNGLILPLETREIEGLSSPVLFRDAGGAVQLPTPPREAIDYQVFMGPKPLIAAERYREAVESSLDTTGVSDAMRQHATKVMGDGPNDARADRLLRHLLREYGYTTDYVDRSGTAPLDDFLFLNQRGHCELFASAMVLLLRSEGIPARFVAGFLDAEYNPLQDYYIVRQDNAHAWVEAFTETRGWQVYDPTPPDGRPSTADWNLRLGLSQLYDSMIFRWDRYVLSFNAEDQAGVLDRVRGAWSRLRDRIARLWRDEPESDEVMSPPSEGGQITTAAAPSDPSAWRMFLVLPLVMAALIAGWAWRRRAMMDATAAYRQLRAWVSDPHGGDANLAPLGVQRLAARRFPAATLAANHLVALYLEESFAERGLSEEERRQALEALVAVRVVREATRREARRQARRRGPDSDARAA